VIGVAPNHPIDENQPLMKIGLDSLMALEMRNWIATALGRQFSATLLFDYPTLGALADFLLPAETKRERGVRDIALDEITTLSEEEAELLLVQELDASSRRL
jgi:acyl carrier protein